MSIAQHPDRLLPADPAVRSIARGLMEIADTLPIVSPHGHVEASLLADNEPFPDPATLLISPDHYLTRVLHSAGVPLEKLNVGPFTDEDPRDVWRLFCEHWPLFDGTATGYWVRSELVNVFGLDDSLLTAAHADELYDELSARLATDAFRPRALFERFGIEFLATTDDPLADLSAHRRLAEDPTFTGRVSPTFRPDAYVKLVHPSFAENIARLSAETGNPATYAGYLAALAARRRFFAENGGVSSDHGVYSPLTLRMSDDDAAALFAKGLSGEATQAEAEAFEANMTYQFARMSLDDGLVMTLHPGIYRNHSEPTLARFGPDTGHDIPVQTEYTRSLQPLLSDVGTDPRFQLVLFTTDETSFSREIAPLAGFYPSVYVGAPWWFLDEPDAMHRFRSATTGTVGFSRSSGFIDDTRAFCSIPARHDAARRVDAGYLARLVAEYRITQERAEELIVELTDRAPRKAFRIHD
jgi:glucuronate isomerase